VQVELTKEERQQLLKFFEQLDTETLKATFEAISMMVRAFEGRPIEPEDVITRLTNVKNILERSRFPTYPLLAKQVYLRLIAKYNPQAYACRDWADMEAEALIEYRGQGRTEYVEMTREFYFGEMPRVPVQGEKKRFGFLRRKPSSREQSEFEHQ